jgi:putative Mn2+ efflux pump MntP
MRLHKGTLLAGIVFLLIGVAFILEALEVWTMQISDLRYIGPLALVVLGIAVVIGSMGRGERQQ